MSFSRIEAYQSLTPTMVVEQLKVDLQDPLFLRLAMATFSNQKYYLSADKFSAFLNSKKAPVADPAAALELDLNWPGWLVLDAMSSGDLSGDAAKRALAEVYLPLPAEDREVLLKILDKTWRYGVTQDTINLARPKTFRPVKLMLAHKLKDRIEHDAKQRAKGKPETIPWPLVATFKYDGFRSAFEQATRRGLSREGNPFPLQDDLIRAKVELAKALASSYGLDYTPALDTELFKGNWRDTAKARKEGLGYDYAIIIRMMHDDCIYGEYTGDTVYKTLEFFELVQEIVQREGLANWLTVPDYKLVHNAEEALAFGGEVREKYALEGLVCVPLECGYESKRSYNWLKEKNEETEDLPITGYNMADARSQFAGKIGAIEVERNGVRSYVHGIKSKLRDQLTEMGDEMIGLVAEVSYHELTPDGCLRHGVLKKIRFDKGVNS